MKQQQRVQTMSHTHLICYLLSAGRIVQQRTMMRALALRSRRVSTLYMVSSPIGDVNDITVRALEVLRSAQLILAEDTRSAERLLRAHAHTLPPLLSCHQHNASTRVPTLLSALSHGHDVAYVCEAGTPGVSDPGDVLVRAARGGGFAVTVLPGPCAATCAVTASGWDVHAHYGFPTAVPPPTVRSCGWAFLGFLPAPTSQSQSQPDAARHAIVSAIAVGLQGMTVVLYESPARVRSTLVELSRACEGHPASVQPSVTQSLPERGRGEGSTPAGVPPSVARKRRREAKDRDALEHSIPGMLGLGGGISPSLPPPLVQSLLFRRPTFIARELTKRFEQTAEFPSLQAAAAAIVEEDSADWVCTVPARGEFTLLIGPAVPA